MAGDAEAIKLWDFGSVRSHITTHSMFHVSYSMFHVPCLGVGEEREEKEKEIQVVSSEWVTSHQFTDDEDRKSVV